MIVIPQSFNYRLIIGTLVIALAILGSYSISSFNAFQDQEEFLEQETKLVQNELSEMISLYDDVAIENEEINSKLEQSRTKVINILDSVKKVKANLSLISSYRTQINSLKNDREVIFDQIDSLVRNNKTLKVQVDSVSQQFESQRLKLAYLTEKNNNLYKIVSKVSLLKAKNIKIAALKTTSSLAVFETEKLSETDHIEVCTTLSTNEYTTKGNKNIYVQILDPNNVLVSERGILKFQDIELGYSGKTTIRNISEDITACLKISIVKKEKLIAGTYSINVFQNASLLGSTTLKLK